MSENLTARERELYEASKLDPTIIVGSDIRELCGTIERLRAELTRLREVVSEQDVESIDAALQEGER